MDADEWPLLAVRLWIECALARVDVVAEAELVPVALVRCLRALRHHRCSQRWRMCSGIRLLGRPL